MRWLVTGGCGFIGRNLARSLLASGEHSVRVLDNLSVGTRSDLLYAGPFAERMFAEAQGRWPSSGLELLVGDILDEEAVLAATSGADVVVHLAANTGVEPSVKDPKADCRTNVLGTLNCLEAARAAGVRRFVFASSGAPVGETEPPIHEEKVPHPVSPYGASKLAGEGYCSAYARTFGIETVTLRFGNVYGPGSTHKTSVVAKFIRRALAGEPLEIYGDGEQTRDFLYVDDLLDAVMKAATALGIGGHVFQIATGSETTVNELLAELIQALAGFGIDDLRVGHAASRLGDVRRNYSDTSKARDLLGWTVRTRRPEGLARTVRWFLDHRASVSPPAA